MNVGILPNHVKSICVLSCFSSPIFIIIVARITTLSKIASLNELMMNTSVICKQYHPRERELNLKNLFNLSTKCKYTFLIKGDVLVASRLWPILISWKVPLLIQSLPKCKSTFRSTIHQFGDNGLLVRLEPAPSLLKIFFKAGYIFQLRKRPNLFGGQLP